MTRPLAALLAALLLAAPPVAAQTASAASIALDLPPDPATTQISVQVRPGLKRTTDLKGDALRQARRDMLADLPVQDADLRALAEAGDGLAAQKYAKSLVERGNADPADLAYYGSLALVTGRAVWLLPRVVEALRHLDPATVPEDRVKLYADLIYGYAWAGNGLALDALIDLNGQGRLFGPMSEDTRKRLLDSADASTDGRLRFRLALSTLQIANPTPEELAAAREDLTAAAQQGDLAMRTMANTLLARLGPAPQ